MIFFLLHSILKPLLDTVISHQTANLTTFLIGTILWTYLWVYVTDYRFQPKDPNFIITGLAVGFSYFLISDIIAVCILYKNYWKRSILTELKDLLNPKKEVTSATSAEEAPKQPVEAPKQPVENNTTPTEDVTPPNNSQPSYEEGEPLK